MGCKVDNYRVEGVSMTDYLVTLLWGAGYFAQLDVPSRNPQAASRRAWLAGLQMGWYEAGYDEMSFEVYDEDISDSDPVWIKTAEEHMV